MNKLYIILFSMIFIFVENIYSQQKNYVLGSAESNQANAYEARDFVKFTDGYTFKSGIGQTMNAKINEGLNLNIDYLENDSLFLPENYAIDKNLTVGSSGGTLNVSQTGAATYNIPIICPPGINGLEPNISINYNSQNNNGLLGNGWNLTGLSNISRVPQNLYNDNNITSIDLSYEDRFSLDGNRLILETGDYGKDNSVYTTETQNFYKITAYNYSGNGPSYFIVETKDGKKFEYGNTVDSKLKETSSGSVITWRINKITDVFGNNIIFRYTNSDGEQNIKSIEYAGNNHLEFIYEKRQDVKNFYLANTLIPQTLVLSDILVKNNNELLKKYHFNYKYTNKTLLSTIEEFGLNNKKLNPIVINYSDKGVDEFLCEPEPVMPAGHLYKEEDINLFPYLPFKYTYECEGKYIGMEVQTRTDGWGPYRWCTASTDNTNWWGAGPEECPRYTADVNGDGFNDFIAFSHQGVLLSFSEGVNVTKPVIATTEFGKEYDYKFHIQTVADMDGDGKTDLVGFADNGVNIALSNGNGFDPSSLIISDFGAVAGGWDVKNHPRFIADIDGDGFLDIVGFADAGVKIAFSNKNTISSSPRISFETPKIVCTEFTSWDYNKHLRMVNDMNGDGRADLIEFRDDGVYVALSKGRTFGNKFKWTNGFGCNATSGGWRNNLDPRYIIDVNGDGLKDIVGNGPNGSDWVSYSKGVIGTEPICIHYSPSKNATPVFYSYADMNADGLVDVIYLVDKKIYVRLFDGTHLSESKLWTKDEPNMIPGYFDVRTISDINGDGILDYVVFDFYYLKVYFSKCKKELVSSIIDGFNNKYDISYMPLTIGGDTYIKKTDASYPVIDIQVPFYVVTNTKLNNGIDQNINYFYEGAKYHTKGKGFLGFTSLKSKNLINYIETTQNFELSRTINSKITYFPICTSIITKLRNADFNLSETSYNYDYYTYQNDKSIYCYLSSSANIDNLKKNKQLKLDSYSNEGNLLSSSIKNFDIQNNNEIEINETITNYNDYIDNISTDGNNYKNANTETETILKNTYNPGKSFVQKTKYYYDTSNGIINKSENFYDKPIPIETSFEYYSNGQINKTTTRTNDINTEERISSIEYDNSGRFPVKVINSLGYSAEKVFNYWGNPIQSKDLNGNITYYKYDEFENLVQIISPSGVVTKYTTNWDPNISTGIIYYSTTTVDNIFIESNYFDNLGREKKKIIQKNGINLKSDIEYNSLGQIKTVTEYYPINSSSTNLISNYTYDMYGRVTSVTNPKGVVQNFSYCNSLSNKIERITFSTGEIYEKSFDASGLLLYSIDPGGKIENVYNCSGNLTQVKTPGNITDITYDEYNRQESITEPNMGKTTYKYNGFGEICEQKDQLENISKIKYDKLGRVVKKTITDKNNVTKETDYIFNETPKTLGTLNKIQVGDDNFIKFTYSQEGLCRLLSENKTVDNQSFTYNYEYFDDGRLKKMVYPAGLELSYEYNSNKDLFAIYSQGNNSNPIWKQGSVNSYGNLTTAIYGNNKVLTLGYDTYNRLSSINVPNIIDFNYTYSTRNQLKNRNEFGLSETFTYDGTNRLQSSNINNLSINYVGSNSNQNDRIVTKSDVGDYSYLNGKYQLENIKLTQGHYLPKHEITYNIDGKTDALKETEINGKVKMATFVYGADEQRFSMNYEEDNQLIYTRYYFDKYEKELNSDNSLKKHISYIYAPTGLIGIYEQNSTTSKMHYIYTDYLGSIKCITDENGTIEQKLSYDAWGKRRSELTGSPYLLSNEIVGRNFLFSRGYTGHEHLDEFNLINMNGRIYDPTLGVFLSADKYVQSPDFTQNYNRYGYCLNNPMMYTDPSGELIETLIFAAWMILKNYNDGVNANNGQLNPFKWNNFEQASFIVGGNINSNGDWAVFGGGGISQTQLPVIGYSSENGMGFGMYNMGNTNMYYPSVNFNASEQRANRNIIDIRDYYANELMNSNDNTKFKYEEIIKNKYPGIEVYRTKRLDKGVTLPPWGIFIPKNYPISWVEHEYGHYLQYKDIGFLNYYSQIGIPSILNSIENSFETKLYGGPKFSVPHAYYSPETDANDYAKKYFGEKAPINKLPQPSQTIQTTVPYTLRLKIYFFEIYNRIFE